MTGARDPLQKSLNYVFRDETLLKTALTHASAAATDVNLVDYERMEFLGDRVLGLIVAERLYALYPQETEGDLSKRHTALVRAETLARAARRLNLGDVMVLSESEKAAGGTHNENILSDMMEAIIGAVFLDGGMDAARNMFNPLLDDDILQMANPPRDAKTALQEWAQGRGMPLPEYVVVSRTGPDHAPDFTVSVTLTNGKKATAKGASKRAAEKQAAQTLLDQIEKNDD